MTTIVGNVPGGDAGIRRKRAREILARLELRSACGGSIAIGQQARAILEPQLNLVLLLEEAVRKVSLRRGWMEFEVDLNRRIGWDSNVQTGFAGIDDEACFVMRRGHAGASRVVVKDLPALKPSSKVTLIIDGGWPQKRATPHLVTGWIGSPRPPEPWEPRLSGQQALLALEFWSSHALDVQSDAREGKPFRSTFREVIKEAKLMLAYHQIRPGKSGLIEHPRAHVPIVRRGSGNSTAIAIPKRENS